MQVQARVYKCGESVYEITFSCKLITSSPKLYSINQLSPVAHLKCRVVKLNEKNYHALLNVLSEVRDRLKMGFGNELYILLFNFSSDFILQEIYTYF